ncbi:Hsp20/alpha crystallin family protein [Polaribacter gochangensis]|uniref:Hsp20/alpha crystallin family protein n=1 Tax=Polaribacter gochangensis TaxID=3252903 RepID=UPI0039048458
MLAKRNDAPFVPTLFNDLFRDWSTTNFSETNTTLPAVNIKETQDEFVVDVAVPGMEKKDFKIDLDNDVLTISSEKTVNNEETKENYTRKEYSYRSFKRSFTLPQGIVNRDKIEAIYKSGELKITIPKLEEAKPKPIQLIEVK